MKIEKYLTNKDITLTNDDIDVQKLIQDLQNGMVSESEMAARLETAKKDWEKESSSKYSELEEKYNELEKRNTGLTEDNSRLKLENVMTREGFKSENFKEISTLRNTLYADEKDDEVAIKGIKEKFKDTYFHEEKPTPVVVPQESEMNTGTKIEKPIQVNRNTRVSSLFIKK